MGKIMCNGKSYSGSFDKAINTSYDNSTSGLSATNVQDAVDEVNTNKLGLKTDLGVDANQVAVLKNNDKYVMHFYKDGAWLTELPITELNKMSNNTPKTFTEMWEIGHSLYGGGLYIPLITNCKNISITSVQVFMSSGWVDVRFSSYRQAMGKTIIVCDHPEGVTFGQSYLVRLTGSVS